MKHFSQLTLESLGFACTTVGLLREPLVDGDVNRLSLDRAVKDLERNLRIDLVHSKGRVDVGSVLTKDEAGITVCLTWRNSAGSHIFFFSVTALRTSPDELGLKVLLNSPKRGTSGTTDGGQDFNSWSSASSAEGYKRLVQELEKFDKTGFPKPKA